MYDLKTNLAPGNPEGHTVLRYLVEAKQMPLEVAIERVYHTVSKYAALYQSDQKKLLTGMFVTGILGLPVFFPFGVSSLLIAGAIGASAFSWQEFGMMRDRLKPEYAALRGSVLLEQFIKWLAQELKERSGQAASSGQFQPDALTTANILAAYEHTIFAVTDGEHLENNASDPILALFVAKLRLSTNQLPSWVMDAFRHLEQAEAQRRAHVDAAYGYMFGNLSSQTPTPSPLPQIGQNTQLRAVDVPVTSVEVEGENRLGKPMEEIEINPSPLPQIRPKAKQIVIVFFDFTRLRTEPDKFAHLRVIGGTGIGKTTFVDWLLDILGGECFVITPKKKARQWIGLQVEGLWFDYEAIRSKLQWIHAQMYRRFPLINEGAVFELTNFVVDEWRLINLNVKAIKEKDPETKAVVEVAPSAKAMMKDIITVSREASFRLIGLAQGERVETWGLEGEGDLEECFTDIRLGEFAINYAHSRRGQCRKDSEEYSYWSAVLAELEWQESRRTKSGKSLPCCLVGKMPARIPDLSDWQRQGVEEDCVDSPLHREEKSESEALVEDLNWNQMILGMSEEQINELIEQRRANSVSQEPDTTDTSSAGQDTADTVEIRPDTPDHNDSEPADTVRDTYLDTDTYTPEDLDRDFPDTTPEELFHRIQNTTLPPSRFIKEELKYTKPERYRVAQKAIGYLLRKYGNFKLMEKFKDYL